jgi:16S rRNA processing protein RimM
MDAPDSQDSVDLASLSFGVLGRPHGVHGEIKLRPHNPASRELGTPSRLVLVHPDGRRAAHEVAALRAVADGYLVRFTDVADRDAAAALTLAEVRVPRAALPALAPGEYYVQDVIGCEVTDEAGRALGRVMETFWNGAHDVATVAGPDGRERLVPLVADFVLDVDAASRKMRVRWSDDD